MGGAASASQRSGAPGGGATWYRTLAGIGAAASYCAVAIASFRSGALPGRVLFDGLVPPPAYRWVRPPEPLAASNVPPEPGGGMLTLSPSGSAAATIFTDDHQVVVTFRQGAIAFRAGEAFVRITLTPLDPMAVGPPPAGLRFDSNAYRIAAAYALSGSPASLGEPAVVVMRYASGATGLLQAQRAGWTPMAAGNVRGAMQLLAEVTALGTFAAAAPQDLPFVVQTPGWAYAIVVGVVLIPILYAWALLRPGSKSRRRR